MIPDAKHGCRFKDETGNSYSRLTVLRLHSKQPDGKAIWLCRCRCGAELPVLGKHLRTGNTKSCGCLKVETTIRRSTKHGGSRSNTYASWSGMIQRCENPKRERFAIYGGRGIRVCDRWHFFGNFLADMGHRPTPKHSIDRINVDGNYEPSNCRWATVIEQANNKRPRA